MIPRRYPVLQASYTGQGTEDGYGNEVASWAPPALKLVYGVNYPRSDEPADRGPNGLVVDLILLVPPDFTVYEKDKFTLPRRNNETYEAVGISEDAEGNPLAGGWNPGGRVKLVRVHG